MLLCPVIQETLLEGIDFHAFHQNKSTEVATSRERIKTSRSESSTGLGGCSFTLPLDQLRRSGTVSSLPFLPEARLCSRLKLACGHLSTLQSHLHFTTNLQSDKKSYSAFITTSSAWNRGDFKRQHQELEILLSWGEQLFCSILTSPIYTILTRYDPPGDPCSHLPNACWFAWCQIPVLWTALQMPEAPQVPFRSTHSRERWLPGAWTVHGGTAQTSGKPGVLSAQGEVLSAYRRSSQGGQSSQKLGSAEVFQRLVQPVVWKATINTERADAERLWTTTPKGICYPRASNGFVTRDNMFHATLLSTSLWC